MKYIALLRGINVGGKTLIKMADLQLCIEELGYKKVKTYINSGNVIFESDERDEQTLAHEIEKAVNDSTKLDVRVVVISEDTYTKIIKNVPEGWGERKGWKYNTLFLIPPYDIKKILEDIGELKPDIEVVVAGQGVIYQALLFEKFGRTSSGKLASRPSYKQMTIRNWNTTRKLLELLEL